MILPSSFCLLCSLLAAEPIQADLVLRGGTIYDGTAGEAVVGDVAILKDRIVAVGKFETAGQPKEFDAKGLVIAPGFIDLHTHSDDGITQEKTRLNANF